MRVPQLESSLTVREWADLEFDLFDGAGMALSRLRDFARSRYLPPVAFVISVCLRVLSSLPGNVTFDAGVGVGSLNFFVALVGRPGQGKDRLMAATNQAVTVTADGRTLAPEELSLGSGEGVTEALQPAEGQLISAPVLFGASEVGEVGALMGRTGSTLRGNLLKIYAGNPLGFTNRSEKITLSANSYTAGLWVGVQPDKAGALLEGEDDGLRHRFIWTELVDPSRPNSDCLPAELKAVEVPPEVMDGAPIRFHSQIVRETMEMAEINLRFGVQGSNSGHRHQTKLKLAVGLALIRSGGTVDLDDWKRAGVLMQYSESVQKYCQSHLDDEREKGAAKRLERQERAAERVREDRMLRFRRKVLQRLEDGDVVTRSEMTQSVRGDQRADMAHVLEILSLDGLVTVTDGDNGTKYLQCNPNYTGRWE